MTIMTLTLFEKYEIHRKSFKPGTVWSGKDKWFIYADRIEIVSRRIEELYNNGNYNVKILNLCYPYNEDEFYIHTYTNSICVFSEKFILRYYTPIFLLE